MTINLIYIGDKYYYESGTMMGVLYGKDEHGFYYRSDWGKIKCYLSDGLDVKIRPATINELEFFDRQLKEYKEEK